MKIWVLKALPSRWRWAKASAPLEIDRTTFRTNDIPLNGVAVIASLLSVTSQTPQIRTLRLNVALRFKPGQAIQICFPGDPKKRFYSISSSPSEGSFVEITVQSEPGSAVAGALANLKRGDALEIEGPSGGELSLPDPVNEPLCFIAAGTGVTPFRSMIRHLMDQSAEIDYWLLHSVKTRADLLFRAEFSDWSGARKNFHYVPTLTKDFDDNWKNETGRISEALVRKHVQDKPCTFLLCGPASFVSDMEGTLRQTMNVPEGKIRREKW
jgi:ferredoxin-NADP reductase